MKQHAQFSDLLLRMISQVFHEGRLFRNCHNHVHSPPHSAYRYPLQLRRKKPGKVSWEATSFKESFGAPEAVIGGNRQFAYIFARKRVLQGGPNWLPGQLYVQLHPLF
jgi:hypothetical protein